MDQTIGYNVHNTNAHAPKTMAYFEKHRLSQIYQELLVLIARDRPKDLNEYIGRCITRVGRSINPTLTTVLVPPNMDSQDLALKYGTMYNCPVIKYTRERTDGDVKKVLQKLRRFSKFHGLSQKHLLSINFPANRIEVVNAVTRCFAPTSVVQVIPSDDSLKMTCIPRRKPDTEFLKDFKQVKDYFPDRSVELRIGSHERDGDKHVPIFGVKSTCRRIHQVVRQPLSHISHRLYKHTSTDKWYPRVMIIGRRGSGRKTQASMLARSLGLVYVDIDFLKLQYMQDITNCGQVLMKRARVHDHCGQPLIASILQKRLMQPDCLHNGWVVVGFPLCVDDAKFMDENFVVPPNKVIFLHCRIRECQRRMERLVEKQEKLAANDAFTRKAYTDPRTPRHTCDGVHLMMDPIKAHACIEKEHVYYSLHIRDLAKYFGERRSVSHVDGTHSASTVHQQIAYCATHEKIDLLGEQGID